MEAYRRHPYAGPHSNILHNYMYKIVVFVFWVFIILHLPRSIECHDHILHQHRHGDESPATQYTKAANLQHQENTSFKQNVKNFWNWLCTEFSNNFLSFAKKPEGSMSVWTQALGSTVLISAIPFLILYFVPLDASEEKQCLLKVLLGFASGGLLGDSFLHLIPHSLGTHHHHGHHNHHHHHHHHHHHGHKHHPHQNNNHHHHDDGPHPHDAPRSQILTHIEDQKHFNQTVDDIAQAHSDVGFYVLLGIIVFLVIEKSVRLVNKGHSHSHNRGDSNKKRDGSHKGSADGKKGGQAGKKQKKDKEDSLTVAGYLNLAADFAHNFTDGLAIGASYLAGKNIGFVTTMTILLHEIPHEIGDFAILIQSGCSRKKAMGLQLVTALGAVLGTLIALWAEGGDISSSWILPFTAGGFIYISTVSILPELLQDSSFFQSLKEILALIVGVFLMIIIADIE